MFLDFRHIVLNLLPPHWRKDKIIAWMYALVSPLRLNHSAWQRWANDVRYRLSHTGQVCKLEKVLNEVFDPVNKGIVIMNTGGLDLVFVAPASDNGEVYTDFYIAGSQWYEFYIGYNFIVLVPGDVAFDEGQMRGLLNYYKLVSKNYKITIN